MPHLTLHLTGPFRADLDGAPLTGLSRRGQAAMAWLACQPGMRGARGALADLLWSDRSEAQARASLRQELSVLRKALGEVLGADRGAVWLVTDTVTVRRGEGDFLQGFDLPSEGFEDWLRAERAQAAPAPAARPVAQTRATLAVLPFDELGVPESDMFAEGVVEEITGALSRNREFDVIARQSAYALKGAGLSIPEAAERLSADYLLEGSVRRSGARVRIAVQLVRGADGHMLWSERFDDRLDDLFDLQDRVAMKVAGQLSPSLREAEIARARGHAPEDRTAYDLMLTALPHFWAHRRDENAKAIALLARALAHQPGYPLAMAYKAWCHAHQCCYLWTEDGAVDKAQALSLMNEARPRVQDDPAALVALSAVAGLAANEFDLADELARRALALDPNNAWGWLRMGWTQVYLGDFDAAAAAFDRYDFLSPLDPFHFNGLFGRAAALRAMRRFDESIALTERGLREGTGVTWAYRMLFGTHWVAGNREAAMDAARKWRDANPHVTWEHAQTLIPKWTHDPEYMDALERLWALE